MAKKGKYGQGRVYQPKYKACDCTGECACPRKTVNKWYVQFYDRDGNQHREPTDAKSEKEARGILADRISDVRKGVAKTVEQKGVRYGTLRAKILAVAQAANLKSLELLSNGEYSLRGLTKLDGLFGYHSANGQPEDLGIKMEDFTSDMWDEFVSQRRLEGVSDATIRSSGKILRRIYKIAIEKKLLHTSDEVKITLPKAPKAKKDFLTFEAFQKMLRFLPLKFRPYAVWLFYQATRKNEALDIVWGQINLPRAEFYPDASKNKTEDNSTKGIVAPVIEALKHLGKGQDDERVFEGVTEKSFFKAFRKAALKCGEGRFAFLCGQCKAVKDGKKEDPTPICEACKKDRKRTVPMQFQYVGITPHGLRRSAMTLYAQGGLGTNQIMGITGHTSEEVAQGYIQPNARLATERANEVIANHNIKSLLTVEKAKQLPAG